MTSKQKLSFLSAIVLPLFALAVFLVLTPSKVSAYSCPPGAEYAGYSCYSGGCNNGAGYCYRSGSSGGIYVFCNNSQGQIGDGPGTCSNGCVTCEYGPYY